MAINFPATGGQATDGSFTYTVAGITYAWNGSSWAAAGAGASATNRSLFSVATTLPQLQKRRVKIFGPHFLALQRDWFNPFKRRRE